MKNRLMTWAAIFCVSLLAAAGCSNNNIDTAKVRASLSSVEGDGKVQLDAAMTAIDAGKYSDAVLPLKKIAFGSKLTKEQSEVLKDTMVKVQAKIAKGQ